MTGEEAAKLLSSLLTGTDKQSGVAAAAALLTRLLHVADVGLHKAVGPGPCRCYPFLATSSAHVLNEPSFAESALR